MTAAVPPTEDDVFSVPYSADHVNHPAALSAGLGLLSAVLASVLGVVLTGATWWLALQDGASIGVAVTAFVVTVLMAVTVWVAWRPVRAAARSRSNLAQSPVAMQISAVGVGFPDLDRGGWIVVPWSAITAARVMTWRTVRFLHLELAPGLRADQPGAQGLDDPRVLRDLTRRTMGLIGPRFSLGSLQRAPEEIDSALRLYSGGRLFLT